MAQISAIAQQIWDMKYRLKQPGGAAIDKTVEDSWRRVARALAEPEHDRERWEQRFYEALEGFRFLPAGRILAGAGADRNVTLFNCFVMGTVPDDMGGIFEHLREAALTMQQGGGIGYDFSTLRPRGAPVKGVGADASGPLSFMDVWDAMCRTIMSAGHRRGAMMATMRCDHPDIEDFVAAKQEAGRLRMFNLSVLVTDDFMAAVRKDAPWELKFGGSTFRVVQARELWDKIIRATYAYAEPGVIFIDRINKRNNLHYCETISATNPCITGESWVHTEAGPRQARELVGAPSTLLVDGTVHATGPEGFFSSGIKPVFRLTTVEGPALRLTADHPVRRVTVRTRWRCEFEWTPASTLRAGDRIKISDHRAAPDWPGEHGMTEGYLLGLLVGDGTLKADKAILSVWQPARAANGSDNDNPGASAVMSAAEMALRTLPHRSDFAGWMAVTGRNEYRMATSALRDLAHSLGMRPGDKRIGPAVERCSSEFYSGFLRGLFDADGSVQGTQRKGVSVRLAQSDLPRLEAVQRMLLRLGIASTIYSDRRPAGSRVLPDGHGSSRDYPTLAQHELVIGGDNLERFEQRVGFTDVGKATRLRSALASYRRALNREPFVVEVSGIEPDGEEEVFDVRVPGANAFCANGLYVHNCGEQPLPPYGACLLGSINLATLVVNPFEPEAALDIAALEDIVPVAIRMMDNAIDVSKFPLAQQTLEARAKRRIGLGITGLGDALIMCNVRYGSKAAVALTEHWMYALRNAAYRASIDLAVEKGAFPLFDKEPYLAGETIRELPEALQSDIAKHGIRNALVTSVAPTGTISLFAGNVSSGLEPVFSFKYTRNILMPDGSRRQEEVTDYAYRRFRDLRGDNAPLPDAFVDAQTLMPGDHLVMQAVVQKYIDSSISKTINCPADLSFEAFKDVYAQAYELGCKGCTTYRPNDVTGAVLELSKPAPVVNAEPELPLERPQPRPADIYEAGGVVYMTRPLDRPEALPGRTYKVRWPESDHALYITINDIVKDGRRRPFEVFINSKNMDHYAWTLGLTRMISAVFRRGGDVSFVVEELKAVFDPRGGSWMDGRYVPSLLAAIGEVIERHMIDIGFMPDSKQEREELLAAAVAAGKELPAPGRGTGSGITGAGPSARMLPTCPKCQQPALICQEGCDLCTSCGFSRCG